MVFKMPENKEHKLPVLAVDIGGTKILTAIVTDNGEMVAREYIATLANEGPQAVIARLLSAIEHLLRLPGVGKSGIDSISIACAGGIDMKKGVVTQSPNLPGWRDIPLRDRVVERFGINVFVLNDANAAALGELHFGAGKGANDLIFVTLSTGIGGGIIMDGRLYPGASGCAGEMGHATINVDGPRCSCGNFGCWEMFASGGAIAREAKRRISRGEKSSLIETVKGGIENITAEKVSMAAQAGDALAMDVIAQAANYFGVGIVNLVNIFNPEVIIVGGGVAKIGDLLFEPARRLVRERAFQLAAQVVRIVPAQLGDDAGVLGATVFAWQQK